jgi:hypothetical protein
MYALYLYLFESRVLECIALACMYILKGEILQNNYNSRFFFTLPLNALLVSMAVGLLLYNHAVVDYSKSPLAIVVTNLAGAFSLTLAQVCMRAYYQHYFLKILMVIIHPSDDLCIVMIDCRIKDVVYAKQI